MSIISPPLLLYHPPPPLKGCFQGWGGSRNLPPPKECSRMMSFEKTSTPSMTTGPVLACKRQPSNCRDKFLHRGRCPFRTGPWGRILGNEFWTPEFVESLDRVFPAKEAPEKFTLKKFTCQNSPSKIQPEIGQKHLHCTSAGPLA